VPIEAVDELGDGEKGQRRLVRGGWRGGVGRCGDKGRQAGAKEAGRTQAGSKTGRQAGSAHSQCNTP
jgi:hypothetical protein